jgi:hypothetical protein
LALGGDAICQLIVEKETLKTFNWRRAYAVTVFGTLYQVRQLRQSAFE